VCIYLKNTIFIRGIIMKKLLLSLLLFSLAALAHAGTVLPGVTYTVLDHPDAALTSDGPPPISYGIRIFESQTWSFEQDGASVQMQWNDGLGVATMTGQVSNNADDSPWMFNYSMFGATAATGGFISTSATGLLSNGAGITYLLNGVLDGDAVARFLADSYRCGSVDCIGDPMAIVGRGWFDAFAVDTSEDSSWSPMIDLMYTAMYEDDWDTYNAQKVLIIDKCYEAYSPCTMDLTGDFIVTAVPVPAAVWLFGSALVGLVGLRRKQQTS
jgi:hypothetical protein